MLIHDSFSSIGVTGAIMRELAFGRRFRYVGRSRSMTIYPRRSRRRPEPGRLGNAGRQVGQLPWFVRNVGLKVLLTARARQGARRGSGGPCPTGRTDGRDRRIDGSMDAIDGTDDQQVDGLGLHRAECRHARRGRRRRADGARRARSAGRRSGRHRPRSRTLVRRPGPERRRHGDPAHAERRADQPRRRHGERSPSTPASASTGCCARSSRRAGSSR